MNAWRWRTALLVATGAISLVEGIVPARGCAPPTSPPIAVAEDERSPNALHLVWKTPNTDPTKAVVELIGADPATLQALARPEMTVERWSSFLSVRVVRPAELRALEYPPLWGSYRVTGDAIRFVPRFPLEPGMRYHAVFDPARLREIARDLIPVGGVATSGPRSSTRLFADYSAPKKPSHATTHVAEVYPSRDVLPENLLRFYIYFSAPMSRGEAYRCIKLVAAPTGKPVDSAFLELDEELWSPDGTRFTLLIDPGRVKRGLKPREELGPVLEDGKSYSLVIDRDWHDASGNLLKAGFRKTFRAGPADLTSPDPKTWTIDSPRASSRDPLAVRFPEPLDRALLDRLICVQHASATVVPGQVSVGEAETKWLFTPVSPWRQGAYRLVVGTELEDVAGNSVARPFEVDVTGPISVHVMTATVELPFLISAVPR